MPTAPYPVDLHSHTLVSDGVRSPEELVAVALRRELKILAITDHDAIEGIAPARDAAAGTPLEIVAGVEISCDFEGKEIHLLGLGIDPETPSLQALLQEAQDSRRKAFGRAMDRLRTCQVPLPDDLIETLPGNRALGRAHLGRALAAAGHTRNVSEAFARFLGEGCPARVIRDRHSLEEATAAVVEAGGLPFLAHPGGYPGPDFDRRRLMAVARQGVIGLEARHPAHKPGQQQRFQRLARELSLEVTGGSDHHGYPGDRPPGTLGLTTEEFEALADRMGRNK